MKSFNIYLTFDGQCKEAFDFYAKTLGGTIQFQSTFGEMPPQEGMPPLPEEMKSRIMHTTLSVGNNVLMGSDTGGEWAANYQPGNNFSISIQANSKEEADQLFSELAQGGNITMPLSMTFWNSYFGMLVDKFGITWMMSYDE